MDVTPSKGSEVVALSQHSALSIRQIADRLGIVKSSVGRIVKATDENGAPSRKMWEKKENYVP